MAITAKRRKAIDAFMKCFNKKQALLDAGYSVSMATTSAGTVFNDPAVKAEIDRRLNLASHRADISLDWIVQRLKMIADANLGECLDVFSDGSARINFEKLTPLLKKALNKFTVSERKEGRGKNSSVVLTTTVGLSDQLKALELLVRHLGLSKEKQAIELTGEVSLIEQLHAGRERAGIPPEGEEE